MFIFLKIDSEYRSFNTTKRINVIINHYIKSGWSKVEKIIGKLYILPEWNPQEGYMERRKLVEKDSSDIVLKFTR